jgi:hypothetical protein
MRHRWRHGQAAGETAPAAVNSSSTRDCRMRARCWAMIVARRMSGTSSGSIASAFSSSSSNSWRFCAGWATLAAIAT